MPTTTGLATSFINFSRPGASGGGATVTDRDGKIKWAGHNIITNSESFDASGWTKDAMGVAANSTAAPNGTTTADTLTPTNASAYHRAYIGGTVTFPSMAYGVFVKANGYTKVAIVESGTSGAAAAFDLSGSGSVIGARNASGSTVSNMAITSVGNSWFLISCTISFATATAQSFGLHVLSSTYASGDDPYTVWTGNGTSGIYAWGAHLYRSDMQMQLNPAMPAGMQSYYPTTVRNLLGATEDFSSAAWTNWQNAVTVNANAAIAPNGLQTADAILGNGTSNVHYTAQPVPIASTGIYVLSVYAKANGVNVLQFFSNGSGTGSTGYANFSLVGSGVVGTSAAPFSSLAITPVGDGWYRCSALFSNPTGSYVFFSLSDSASATRAPTFTTSGGVYLWGAQLSDSASLDTYVPVYGAAVTSAAYYAPRLDFDGATLAAKGLLVEELRANVMTLSSEISSWGANSGVTATANNTTAPDGTATADKFIPSATAANVLRQPTSASAVHTVSIYAKAISATNAWISFVDFNANSTRAWLNVFTGAKGTTAAGYSTTITPVGNSWYRCTFTQDAAVANPFIQINISNADNSATAVVDGTNGVYLWGCQVEAGSFATSFIPTIGNVTATRAADVASVSTQAFPYSASAGSIVANFQLLGGNTGVSLNVVALEGAVGNATLHREGGTWRYRTELANLNLTNVPDAPVNKIGFAYASSDYPLTPNGGAIQTNTGSGLIGSATTLRIGDGTIYASAKQLNGHIRQITYLPRRISNAELQSRTA